MNQFPTHIVAVSGFIANDKDEILLIKHRENGLWGIPGGQVENGENLINALLRETKEESNMNITVDKLFSVRSNTCSYPGYGGYDIVPTKVIFGFICTYVGGVFKESDETTEALWTPKNQVLNLITAPSLVDQYQAYINFKGDIQYYEIVSRPVYGVKLDRLI